MDGSWNNDKKRHFISHQQQNVIGGYYQIDDQGHVTTTASVQTRKDNDT
jgi:hypothetical protein